MSGGSGLFWLTCCARSVSSRRSEILRSSLGLVISPARPDSRVAPGITQRDNVTLLGLLDGPLGVNRHAANRAVAHDGHDTNDKWPLRARANNTLSLRDRVPTDDPCGDYDEVN